MTTADPFSTPALIGRRDALEAVLGALADDRSGAVVISGPHGTGKRVLLAIALWAARAAGLRMLLPPVGVQPDTRPPSFVANLRRRLDLPASQKDAKWRSFVDDLQTRAPLVIPIDVYQPSEAFDTWLRETLVAGLVEATGPPVDILLTARPEEVERWPADLVQRIEIEPFTVEDLTDHVDHLSAQLATPMEEAERAAIVERLQLRPDLIDPLIRSLTLDRRAA